VSRAKKEEEGNQMRVSLGKPWMYDEEIIVHVEKDDMIVPVTTFAKLIGVDARTIKYELEEFLIQPNNVSFKFGNCG
jgi:hypothetical protein